MNSLRSRPARLGLLLSAPFRWAAPSVIPSACQLRPFSQSPQLFDAESSTPSGESASAGRRTVPAPIPLVPDVATLLSVIGRNMKQHTVKFPTWEALFTLSSKQLRELGVEPTRDRRYLLRWLQKFRLGEFGIGGDFKYVRNGVAELRVEEVVDPNDPVVLRKRVVNVPVPPPAAPEASEASEAAEGEEAAEAAPAQVADTTYDLNGEPARVRGYKVVGAKAISGPFALPIKDNVGSRVTVLEGMWEHKLGRKIDGGERRRAEVRFKQRAAERRAERERG
ncbi:igr protein domain-containing protein [Ophiostoma piceae UAMH 11346]|uniref:Small ribosomal subunit protein mS41 n=1 Tax=Ophiostoma piceae (strain UAMH 11346) TaxID=1262450 RepID=S3D867_OPHP1|nr:igr protein domain-containing protein [Ophiostoma piceae UAMH 11346]